MEAEDLETRRHQPVFERRFFEVGDAIEVSRHPIARIHHVARDLGLHRIHIVHQGRRTDQAGEKSERREKENDQVVAAKLSAERFLRLSEGLGGIWMRHFLSHRNNVSRPHN